jgi:hypothetical protein
MILHYLLLCIQSDLYLPLFYLFIFLYLILIILILSIYIYNIKHTKIQYDVCSDHRDSLNRFTQDHHDYDTYLFNEL